MRAADSSDIDATMRTRRGLFRASTISRCAESARCARYARESSSALCEVTRAEQARAAQVRREPEHEYSALRRKGAMRCLLPRVSSQDAEEQQSARERRVCAKDGALYGEEERCESADIYHTSRAYYAYAYGATLFDTERWRLSMFTRLLLVYEHAASTRLSPPREDMRA